jgi:hypothetical protein
MSDTFRKVYKEQTIHQCDSRQAIIEYAEQFEELIKQFPSREASLAMTNLEQAVMWAVKAISA